MSIEEKSVFYSVIGKLREQYPKKDINMVGGRDGDEFVLSRTKSSLILTDLICCIT